MLTNSEFEQIRRRANEALAIWNRSGAEFARQIQQALEPYNALFKELQQQASVAVEALRRISDQISPA
jgi:hypothetical protein